MFLERLYKKDSNGKIRIIDIEIQGNKYRTIHGIIDGEKTTSEWTECEGKNIGKTNETTGETQAVNEAQAHHKKKLKQHHYLDVNDIPEDENGSKYFMVMLATEKNKIKNFPQFPYLASYKLDGLRLVKGIDFKHSRNGEPVPSTDHFNTILSDFFNKNSNIILDGEVYNHSLKHDFEHLMHLARRSKLNSDEIVECSEILEYHVYDCFSTTEPDLNSIERYKMIESFVNEINNSRIKLVHSKLITNEYELSEFENEALNLGYEGIMLRIPNEKYVNKRTKSLIKVKQFITEEFEILDIVEGIGNRSGMAGNIRVLVDGEPCDCGIKGDYKYATNLLLKKDEFIGKLATVKYFGRTKNNLLRFPTCVDIDRVDKL